MFAMSWLVDLALSFRIPGLKLDAKLMVERSPEAPASLGESTFSVANGDRPLVGQLPSQGAEHSPTTRSFNLPFVNQSDCSPPESLRSEVNHHTLCDRGRQNNTPDNCAGAARGAHEW